MLMSMFDVAARMPNNRYSRSLAAKLSREAARGERPIAIPKVRPAKTSDTRSRPPSMYSYEPSRSRRAERVSDVLDVCILNEATTFFHMVLSRRQLPFTLDMR
jgi:hypothetical protein